MWYVHPLLDVKQRIKWLKYNTTMHNNVFHCLYIPAHVNVCTNTSCNTLVRHTHTRRLKTRRRTSFTAGRGGGWILYLTLWGEVKTPTWYTCSGCDNTHILFWLQIEWCSNTTAGSAMTSCPRHRATGSLRSHISTSIIATELIETDGLMSSSTV